MPDTPLGKIIEIRSENDKDMLKHFTPSQNKIRHEWRSRLAKKNVMDSKEAARQIKNFQEAMKAVFSKSST